MAFRNFDVLIFAAFFPRVLNSFHTKKMLRSLSSWFLLAGTISVAKALAFLDLCGRVAVVQPKLYAECHSLSLAMRTATRCGKQVK